MAPIAFKAKVWASMQGMGWTFVTLPASASEKLGTKARIPVKGTINGFAFRTSAFPNGKGSHEIAVNAAMKEGADVDAGDEARFVIEPDRDPIKVRVPPALKAGLSSNAKAKAQWAAITPKAQVEWINWINDAKQEATRLRRLEKTVQRLAKGDKRVYDM